MKPSSHLVIVQHNCAGSSFIFHSLFSILSNVDIVAIQDPYLWNGIPLSAPGFSIIFPPVTNVQKVRVCLYISNRFISSSKVSFLPLFFNRDDICGVNFTFPSVILVLSIPLRVLMCITGTVKALIHIIFLHLLFSTKFLTLLA